MNITDSDILSAARELRDEQNARLHVAPNPLKRRTAPTPLWWAATAAALVLGFLVGKGTPDSPPALPIREGAITLATGDEHKTGQVTTPSLIGRAGGESVESSPAIIREVIHEVVHDTIYETRIVRLPVQQVMTAQADPAPSSSPSTSSSVGCSMLCDDIRYDLLSGN